MNLTELQMELRDIEDHISSLHLEIEKMKPQTEETKKADYEEITKLAKQYPIKGAQIQKESEVLQKEYIISLAYFLLTAADNISDKLLYLCRISMGFGLDISAEDIYKASLEFDAEDIDQICKELIDYKYSYLVDALMIANISAEADYRGLSVIADMAKLMGCEKEELRVIAQVAKSRLMDNADLLKDIPVPSKNCWSGAFRDRIPSEWIVSQRQYCGRICVDKYDDRVVTAFNFIRSRQTGAEPIDEFEVKHPCKIIGRPHAGSVVKKGEMILIYDEGAIKKEEINDFSSIFSGFSGIDVNVNETELKERTIVAPCNGIVYFVDVMKKGKNPKIDDKYIDVYVVSYFDDYHSFCEWHAVNKK